MNIPGARGSLKCPGAVVRQSHAMDAWIAWFFASMLTIPLAGELSLFISTLAAIVFWVRCGTPLGYGGVPCTGFWLCALAIGSIVLLKGASWFWSIAPADTLDSAVNHLHFLLWVPLVVLFSRAREPLDAMLLGVRIAIVGLFGWALWFWWRNGIELHPLIRLEAGAQNPGVLGQLATVFALWMGWLWQRMPSWRNTLWVLMAVCPVIAAGGRSHIVVMGFGLTLLCMAFLWRSKKSLRWHVGVVVCGIALAGCLAQVLVPRMLQAWQEMQHYQQDSAAAVGSSVGNRIGLYHVAWKALPDSPWIGFGAGTSRALVERYSPIAAHFAVIRHYHQQGVQVVMETGFLGLLACLAALAAVTRWMRADRRVWPYYLILLGVTAGVGLFTGSLQQGLIHTFVVTVLAVLGAERLKARCEGGCENG